MGVDQISKHDHSSEADGGEDIAPTSVDTDRITVNSEVLVDVLLTSDQSISTATWVTIDFDQENNDVTDDYDIGKNHFSPPEDGHYRIELTARFSAGTNSDTVGLRLVNITDNDEERRFRSSAASAADFSVTFVVVKRLLSAKTYELQARNNSSSDVLEGASGKSTYMTVSREEKA